LPPLVHPLPSPVHFPVSMSISPLPHSIRNSSTEVCLIVKEPQREFKDKVAEQGIDCIKKVISSSVSFFFCLFFFQCLADPSLFSFCPLFS
jgi:Mg2+/citrate symporter